MVRSLAQRGVSNPEGADRRERLLAPSSSGTVPVTMRLDAEVLDWFKARGKGHLTRMQSVLKAYVETQREQTRRSGRRKIASR